jgi:hypothetical protein
MSTLTKSVTFGPTSPNPSPKPSYWLWILGLIGLDYFSTLGYQPSIAYEAAGPLAPLATVVVVIITLFGALPVYSYVTGKSPHGQGATGLLEKLVHGWWGKFLILVLLGFAAADFVVTRTLSLADAAEHIVRNPSPPWQATLDYLAQGKDVVRPISDAPSWHKILDFWDRQMVVTILLLGLSYLCWKIFAKGFTQRVILLSGFVVGLYLAVNAVVIGSGLYFLSEHGEIVNRWITDVRQGYQGTVWSGLLRSDWTTIVPIAISCLLLFPRLSLGLSGFELSMVLMPLIRGNAKDDPGQPKGRIKNARKLLVAAALIMAVFLLGSALVTTTLIPHEAFVNQDGAKNRALAYLAHGGALTDGHMADQINPLFGPWFGTFYDLSSVLILSLAGTSVAIGLRDFVPTYLHRLGMEFEWAHKMGATLQVFMLINLYVTLVYRASVTAQRGAYAASVLVLMTSAGAAVVLDRWKARTGHWTRRLPWFYFLVTLLFAVTAMAIMVQNPSGLKIAAWFILAIVGLSVISRFLRTKELRCEGFEWVDERSKFLWDSMKYLRFPVLVPHRPGRTSLVDKEGQIRERHRLTPDVHIVFIEAHLGDPSDFYQRPVMEVKQEEGKFILRISRCVSISHVIAALALELSQPDHVPEIHFGWSDENPLTANLNFILFGQGNVPWMVRELIRKAQPDPAKQPRIVIG